MEDGPERLNKIMVELEKLYPDAKCALVYKNPLELMIATILSAQCTDVRVNIVTKDLFKKYHKAKDFAEVEIGELEEMVKPTGFYRNKAKNIKAACIVIQEKYKGKVPGTLEELVELPGVGRKTANVVLGNAFDVPGITTDTHVIRLSRLMGLSSNTDPVRLEYDLMDIVPQKQWTKFSHMMIYHGRNICNARKPDCDNCSLRKHCSFGLETE
ncbi:MAG: endonuclease III [Phycisphaerae bacterium]|nr:endonuclease III [Phycisphaerae bacterium]